MSPGARTVLVTGAGRGLGAALADGFLARGSRVIACAREPRGVAIRAPDERLRVLPLDVSDATSIDALALACAGERIDILVHNAAVRGDVGGIGTVEIGAFVDVMAVNVAGPLRMTRALIGAMPPDGRIVFISSRAGSCAEGADPDGDYAYCASKAALNRAMVKLADDVAQIPFALHPGWVRTDLGGTGADMDARVSARALVDLVLSSTPADRGTFRNWDGTSIAW